MFLLLLKKAYVVFAISPEVKATRLALTFTFSSASAAKHRQEHNPGNGKPRLPLSPSSPRHTSDALPHPATGGWSSWHGRQLCHLHQLWAIKKSPWRGECSQPDLWRVCKMSVVDWKIWSCILISVSCYKCTGCALFWGTGLSPS